MLECTSSPTLQMSSDAHSEQDVGTHGLAVRYNRLLVLAFAVPTVQFYTPASKLYR